MKKIAAFSIVLLTVLPAVSYAGSAEVYDKIMHILGQIAVLKAEKAGTAVACEVVVPATAKAGEVFPLIWNSVGAREPSNTDAVSQLPRGNVVLVTKDKPGTYEYKLSFFNYSGEKASCVSYVTIR